MRIMYSSSLGISFKYALSFLSTLLIQNCDLCSSQYRTRQFAYVYYFDYERDSFDSQSKFRKLPVSSSSANLGRVLSVPLTSDSLFQITEAPQSLIACSARSFNQELILPFLKKSDLNSDGAVRRCTSGDIYFQTQDKAFQRNYKNFRFCLCQRGTTLDIELSLKSLKSCHWECYRVLYILRWFSAHLSRYILHSWLRSSFSTRMSAQCTLWTLNHFP